MRVHFHDRIAPRWQLVAGFTLLVLLTTLGTYQYKWLGEVSEAERARMRENLQTRSNEFAADFDRELTRTYLAFHSDPESFDRNPAAAMANAFAAARASGATRIIKDVFLLDTDGAGALRRLDPAAGTLTLVVWPVELQRWRQRIETAASAPGVSPIFLTGVVDADAPALLIPVPRLRRLDNQAHVTVLPDPSGIARAVLIWLDASALEAQLLRPLAVKYFGSDYFVTVARRDDPNRIVFSTPSEASGAETRSPDVTAGLFDLRMDEVNRIAAGLGIKPPDPRGVAGPGDRVADRVAITIVRRANSPGGARVLMTGEDRLGAWQLRVWHRSGSLEAIVARSRRRNLAIGLGVLGLLGASFVLVIATALRQQRLARQQMEFVAAVSHELRTPLAVICSAGENLSDGVVADSQQVKRYGSLIETEGRRLGDMVERVLQFAGIASGTTVRAHAEVDLARVIADAVHGAAADARERGVAIVVRPGAALPATIGDADALRSAVQNVVGNAVKYSAAGGTVEVASEVAGDGIVKIFVSDEGIGIDAADLPHVFKPFYRGRRALDAQVRGTGIGLSVVRQVVQAHGGDIRIESRAGEGTTVTLVLPVQTAAGAPHHRVVRLRPGAAS